MDLVRRLLQKKHEVAVVTALTIDVQKNLQNFLLIKHQVHRSILQFDLRQSLAVLREIVE
jgi:hypothetical protein